MPADDLLYIGHMLDMARQAVTKVQGKTRKEFDEDDNLRLALAYLLQSIGKGDVKGTLRYKCYFLHHASIALCHDRTASAPLFAAHVTLVRDCPQARPSSLAGRPRRSTHR